MKSSIPRLLLFIETSHEFGRSLLTGVLDYSRLYGPWAVHVWPGNLEQSPVGLNDFEAIGIIARISNQKMENFLLNCKIPVVAVAMKDELLNPKHPCSSFKNVHDFPGDIGKTGADFFLEKGLKNFAFVGDPFGSNWSRDREDAFRKTITEAGFFPNIYETPTGKNFSWEAENDKLTKWLQALPKPVGLMTAMDALGRHVIDLLLQSGISVPDEVAVLGVDNDSLICELCIPTLSSIKLNAKECGFRATQTIHLMSQDKFNSESYSEIYVRPLDIIERNSTVMKYSDDPVVERAIRFIWLNSMYSLTVQNVADHLDISRRTLEQRFKNQIGQSVLSKINEFRLIRIKALLTDTNLTIAEIAEQTGFSEDSNLRTFFLRLTSLRMSEFRKRTIEI